MKIKPIILAGLLALSILASMAIAQQEKSIQLPKPNMQGGKPLMQALKDRKSDREFSPRELPLQIISDLLWSAFGINRPGVNGRTAPSAYNAQEIDIYAAMNSGLYVYDPLNNSLNLVFAKDIRSFTGRQEFVKDAPVNLIFVADMAKTAKFGKDAEFYIGCNTGYISQNVYLYCASEGLATVARGYFDEKKLSDAMNLKNSQKVTLAQSVGYPASTDPK